MTDCCGAAVQSSCQPALENMIASLDPGTTYPSTAPTGTLHPLFAATRPIPLGSTGLPAAAPDRDLPLLYSQLLI